MSNIKPVVFNNTVLRDGHQSLAATRMPTEMMLPACPILDSMGFGALETWGGATIDSALRFLGEFPFDRLDTLKKACPKTKHMMLFRGQNIVAYSHFPDDVVEAFVKTSAKHGMDIFRIFDALNDTRNMECSIKAAKAAGANLLRGGAFKPRTSPYSFQGLGLDGLEILCQVKQEVGLPIVTELMSPEYLDVFNEKVDLIQIGARNMQNFDLLKQLGQVDRPILLKRGLNATYEEWIMSAEYIMASGNENVILCERGIRTFETYTRNTLDLQSIPVLRKKTHLPVVIDPSHAGGKWWLVEPMAKAAVAAGADGLMIEVHNNPECALCDGAQSLKPEKYDTLLKEIKLIAEVVGKQL